MVKKPILKFQEHILPTFNEIWGSFRHLVAYESNTNRFGENKIKKNIKEIENILKKISREDRSWSQWVLNQSNLKCGTERAGREQQKLCFTRNGTEHELRICGTGIYREKNGKLTAKNTNKIEHCPLSLQFFVKY